MGVFTIVTSGPYTGSSRNGVVGSIVVNVDGKSFPEAGWRDFVAIVLAWWSEALVALNRVGAGTFSFMDGPYEFRAVRGQQSRVRLAFVARLADGESVEFQADVSYEEVAVAVIAAADSVITQLSSNGFLSAANDLRQAAAVARNLVT